MAFKSRDFHPLIVLSLCSLSTAPSLKCKLDWNKRRSLIPTRLFVFSFQVRWLVALFLRSLSDSGLPRAVQIRPRLSSVSGVPRPEHAQTGSGAARPGRALALPAPRRVSDGEQSRRTCTVLPNWKTRWLIKNNWLRVDNRLCGDILALQESRRHRTRYLRLPTYLQLPTHLRLPMHLRLPTHFRLLAHLERPTHLRLPMYLRRRKYLRLTNLALFDCKTPCENSSGLRVAQRS